MSCNKNISAKNSSCGCGGKPISMDDYKGFNECNSEPCSELFSDECIMHVTESIEYKGIKISKGDRLSELIEKFILLMSGVEDISLIPTGFKVTSKTDKSISLKWNLDSEVSIFYKKEDDEEWKNSGVSDSGIYTIDNLESSTIYNVKVTNDSNESVVITVKTL